MKCNHKSHDVASHGKLADGTFASAPSSAYPSDLCRAIADRLARGFASRPFVAGATEPRSYFGVSSFTPSGRPKKHAVGYALALSESSVVSIRTGAEVKGRSANRQLMRRCRMSMALQYLGFLTIFNFWERSGRDPADDPSSWYGVRAHKNAPPEPRGLPRLSMPPKHDFVVLYCFAGPQRAGDFEYWLREIAPYYGVSITVLCFDINRNPSHDLLNDSLFGMLCFWIHSGFIDAYFGSPPCNTWSRLLYLSNGPMPLRSRRFPFGIKGLSKTAQTKCDRGTELFLRHRRLKRITIEGNGYGLSEHPIDPGLRSIAKHLCNTSLSS